MARKVKISQGSRRKQVVALDRNPVLLSRPLPTLSATFISRDTLNSIFGLRKGTDCMTRFIELNSANMHFLDINLKQVYEPERKGIIIYTGRYAGAIPVKSPRTSLYAVDLKVRGSYSPDLDDDELYSLLTETGAELLPEFDEKLQLRSDSVKPPLYIECENFIMLYERVLASNWTKFNNDMRMESVPRGMTNWNRYAMESYDPERALRFENHINSQSSDHYEWRQINYVLGKAMGILGSSATPSNARKRCRQTLTKLNKLPETKAQIVTSNIPVHTVDPPLVKELKNVGNMILIDTSENRRAWRLDIAKLYEVYVQYIIKKAAPEWRCSLNPHYPIYGNNASWGLRYLEPDIVLTQDDRQIVIDAKYKSNMLVRTDADAHLMKDTFRQDLHQVLAYSAFEPSSTKHAILVYPCQEKEEDDSQIRIRRQTISSSLNNRKVQLSLIGIPFRGRDIKKIVAALRKYFNGLIFDQIDQD